MGPFCSPFRAVGHFLVFGQICSARFPLYARRTLLNESRDGGAHQRRWKGGAWAVKGECLRRVQEGFKGGFSVEAPKRHSGSFLGDSVRILGVSPAVILTFGL